MYKKLVIMALFAIGCAGLSGRELFVNGNFDGKDMPVVSGWASGSARFSIFTEDRSWNRCLKLELLKIVPGKAINLYPYFGRTRNQAGIEVKPNTTYDFSVEVKGTMRAFSIGVIEFFTDEPYYKEGKNLTKRTYTNFRSVKPTANEWSRYSGTFKTDERTKRMALVFSVFDPAKNLDRWKVGDYILFDNISLKESKSAISAAPGAAKIAADVPVTPVAVNFAPSKNNQMQGNIPFSIDFDKEAVTVTVTLPPGKSKKPVSENNSKVWADDVAELFFGPVKSDRLMSQFVVASGGGRHSTDGSRGTFALDSWSGTVKDRVITFRIPFKTLGYDKAPERGDHVLFNIGVQSSGRIYHLPPLNKNSFRDIAHFNTLIWGTLEDHLKKNLPAKAAELAKLPADVAVGTMRSEIRRAELVRFANMPFLAARLHPTRDFTAPLVISRQELITAPVNLKGAVGETVVLPVAIMNRTAKTENYRVVVRTNDKSKRMDRTGLSNNFPAGDIIMREAVAVKMSDSESSPRVFDPLPLMNQAQTVTAAAGESALVWIQFKCRKPGRYSGWLRIIPLSERASFRKANEYKGEMRDYEINLEVLPIELKAAAEGFDSLFHSDDLFYQQQDMLPGPVMSGLWRRNFKFDEKGNVLELNDPAAADKLRAVIKNYKNCAEQPRVKLFLGYNEYRVMEMTMNKKIKPRSPECLNAWRNHLLATAKLMKDIGLKPGEYEIEIWDEPFAKDMDYLLEICKIARETLPEDTLLITWGPGGFGYTAEKIRKFLPYINAHLFHEYSLSGSGMRQLMEDIRKDPGQKLGFYVCSTKMESLHLYYRLFAWRGMEIGAGRWHFYSVIESLWGVTGERNWKAAAGNSVFMDADNSCIPTIRSEALRQGFTDAAYLKLLNDPEKARQIIKRVRIDRSFDYSEPDKAREEVVKALLKK